MNAGSSSPGWSSTFGAEAGAAQTGQCHFWGTFWVHFWDSQGRKGRERAEGPGGGRADVPGAVPAQAGTTQPWGHPGGQTCPVPLPCRAQPEREQHKNQPPLLPGVQLVLPAPLSLLITSRTTSTPPNSYFSHFFSSKAGVGGAHLVKKPLCSKTISLLITILI